MNAVAGVEQHAAAADLASPPARPASLIDVLRRPGVAVTFGASLLARIPATVIGLLVVLRVAPEHGYAAAGVVDGVFAVAVGVFQPISSRAVDRLGQAPVLIVTSLGAAVAAFAIGAIPDDSSVALFAALAALNGAFEPPLGGTMRALWDDLLQTDQERHVGYSLDSAGNEVLWIGSPVLIIGGIAATAGPSRALMLCGFLIGAGGLAFAATRASRRWRASTTERSGGMLGAFASPGIVTLFIASIASGWHFGCVELGLAGYSRHYDANLGLLVGLWGVGSLVAGLAMTRVKPSTDPPRRLAWLLLSLAAAACLFGLAPSLAALTAVLLVGGAGIAPLFTTINGALGDVAPVGTLTEAYGITMTGVMIGATAVAPLSGLLIDHVSASAALAFAGVGPVLGALAVASRRATLRASSS